LPDTPPTEQVADAPERVTGGRQLFNALSQEYVAALKRRNQNENYLRFASFAETTIYIALAIQDYYDPVNAFAEIILRLIGGKSTLTVVPNYIGIAVFSFLAVISTFSTLLTGRGLFVTFLINWGLLRPKRVNPEQYLERLSQVISEVAEIPTRMFQQSPPSSGPQPEDIQTKQPEPARDNIEKSFGLYIQRSQIAAQTALRRPNALLFVGTIIAVAGLIFYVVTQTRLENNLSESFWATMLNLSPRLLMLLFIQVLAGFFLRQYRASMEDFRYYESVLRHREAQYLSYTLRKQLDDKKALLRFADEILKEVQFGILSHGQTTVAIEAQRTEENEFSSLYEKIAALIVRTQKRGEPQPKRINHKPTAPDG
jgi:AraC-like DNA-binding protein